MHSQSFHPNSNEDCSQRQNVSEVAADQWEAASTSRLCTQSIIVSSLAAKLDHKGLGYKTILIYSEVFQACQSSPARSADANPHIVLEQFSELLAFRA